MHILADKNKDTDYLENLGYQYYRDMVITCKFNGANCRQWFENPDFYWDEKYGMCFTFNGNSSDPKYSISTENSNCLVMELAASKF